MQQAVGLLRRTKEPGLKKGSTIKYSMTWVCVQSTHSEVWKASPDSGLGLVFTDERKQYTATMNPIEGIWFNKFMDGLDIRMADITKQDRAFSLGIMHALLMNKYETDWRENGEDIDIDEITATLFSTVTFSGDMRGYETKWTDLAALRAELANIELTQDYRGVADSGEVQGRRQGNMPPCHSYCIHYILEVTKFVLGLENGRKDGDLGKDNGLSLREYENGAES
jgi:hypothetical protein